MLEHKLKLENLGTRYIQSLLNPINLMLSSKIRSVWLEYEEGKTNESRFIREMDKFECMVQAYEYEQRTFGEKDLEEFQGLSSKISSPEGKAWSELLQRERLPTSQNENGEFLLSSSLVHPFDLTSPRY